MNHQSIYIFQRIKHVQKKKICWKFRNVQLLRLYWNQVSACGAFDVLIHFFFLCLTKDQVSYAVNDRHLRTLMLNGTSLKDWSAVKKVMDFFFFRLLLFLYGDSGLFDNECHSSLWMWLGKFISQTKLFETRVWMTSREMYLPFDYGLS